MVVGEQRAMACRCCDDNGGRRRCKAAFVRLVARVAHSPLVARRSLLVACFCAEIRGVALKTARQFGFSLPAKTDARRRSLAVLIKRRRSNLSCSDDDGCRRSTRTFCGGGKRRTAGARARRLMIDERRRRQVASETRGARASWPSPTANEQKKKTLFDPVASPRPLK